MWFFTFPVSLVGTSVFSLDDDFRICLDYSYPHPHATPYVSLHGCYYVVYLRHGSKRGGHGVFVHISTSHSHSVAGCSLWQVPRGHIYFSTHLHHLTHSYLTICLCFCCSMTFPFPLSLSLSLSCLSTSPHLFSMPLSISLGLAYH